MNDGSLRQDPNRFMWMWGLPTQRQKDGGGDPQGLVHVLCQDQGVSFTNFISLSSFLSRRHRPPPSFLFL